MTENNNFDKPFKKYCEQVDILKERGLIIQNPDFAKLVLSTFSYYDLINGYKESFMVDDKYRPNISIEYLYSFSKFDHEVQNIIFKYSVIVETKFKTALAYVISKRYGVYEDAYLSESNYTRNAKGKGDVKIILNKIKKTYKNDSKYIDEPTKHYKLNKNHIPPWILFKNITFNNAINLYSILQSNEKKSVCNSILQIDIDENRKLEIFKNCLSIIRKFRNKIAHNLKFITYKTEKIHLSKKTFKDTPYVNFFKDATYNSAYSSIIAINVVLYNNLDLLYDFNNSLIRVFNQYKYNEETPEIVDDYCKITKIPKDYENYINNFFNDLLK